MKDAIDEAQKLLLENKDKWVPRYKGYAEEINKKKTNIKYLRQTFREWEPLSFYISTTNIKKTKKSLFLDVRYKGQSVATLKATQNSITLSTKSNKDVKNNTNLRDFNCSIRLNDDKWLDDKAAEFRKYFSKNPPRLRVKDNKGNEEHNVESLLLTEFSKKIGKNKQILGIQPIKIGEIRFAMPTPISASDHKKTLTYPKKGGGIDIFARTGKGSSTFLTVIEVKDQNKNTEPPTDALKQAIQYAVFIRELLRSECGQDWYNIFGFSGNVPNKLKIRVACAMPDDILEKSFAGNIYSIGNDELECHYIYFKYDGKQVSNFQTSLI